MHTPRVIPRISVYMATGHVSQEQLLRKIEVLATYKFMLSWRALKDHRKCEHCAGT